MHEPLPCEASDLMPYDMAHLCITNSSLHFHMKVYGLDSFIQQYCSLESILLGSRDRDFKGKRLSCP